MKKFEGLNYSFINEDPNFEDQLIEKPIPVLGTICGSGFRFVKLLPKVEAKVLLFDLSKAQIDFTAELLKVIKSKTYGDFLKIYDPLSVDSPLYQGRHEQFLIKRSKVIQKFLGSWSFTSSLTQSNFPSHRWKIFLGCYSFLLWSLEKTGQIPKRSPPESFSEILKRLDEALWRMPADKNFFFQQTFWGVAQTDAALTHILDEEAFTRIQYRLKHLQLEFYHGSLNEELVKIRSFSSTNSSLRETTLIDFMSLSNIISYLKEAETQQLFESLEPVLAPAGKIVARSFLRHPEVAIPQGLFEITDQYKREIADELTGAYRIKVYAKKSR